MTDLLAVAAGIRCHAFGSVSAFTAQPDQVLQSNVAILDINLGQDQPSGLDAYDWLINHGYRGKVVFLTGHANSHPLVAKARTLRTALVLEKPVSLDRLLELFRASPQERNQRDIS